MYQVIDGQVVTNSKTYVKGDIVEGNISPVDLKRLLKLGYIEEYKEKIIEVTTYTETEIPKEENEYIKELKRKNKQELIDEANNLGIEIAEEETKEEILNKVIESIEEEEGPNTSI